MPDHLPAAHLRRVFADRLVERVVSSPFVLTVLDQQFWTRGRGSACLVHQLDFLLFAWTVADLAGFFA